MKRHRAMKMKTLRNEHGIALVTALVLTLLTLLIVMALLYYLTQGITVTAANKRYASVREASYGGAEVFTKQIIPDVLGGFDTTVLATVLAGNTPSFPSVNCLQSKLNNATGQWGTACGANTATPDPKTAPDVTFQLRGLPMQPNYNVFAKVIDSQPGNSDPTGGSGGAAGNGNTLDTAAGVAYAGPHGGVSGGGGTGGINVMHIPALYRIMVQSESAGSTLEKSQLTLVYVY